MVRNVGGKPRPFGNDKKNGIPDTGASVEGVTSLLALTWNDHKKETFSPETIRKLFSELEQRRKWLDDHYNKVLENKRLGRVTSLRDLAIADRHIEMALLVLRELHKPKAKKAIEELEPEERQRITNYIGKTVKLLKDHFWTKQYKESIKKRGRGFD